MIKSLWDFTMKFSYYLSSYLSIPSYRHFGGLARQYLYKYNQSPCPAMVYIYIYIYNNNII